MLSRPGVEPTMSTDTKLEVSLWEKLGDGLTAVQEGVSHFITRLFGSSNQRYIRKLGYVRAPKPGAQHTVTPGSILDQVNVLEEKMQALSPEGLKEITPQLRAKLAQG